MNAYNLLRQQETGRKIKDARRKRRERSGNISIIEVIRGTPRFRYRPPTNHKGRNLLILPPAAIDNCSGGVERRISQRTDNAITRFRYAEVQDR